MKTKSLKQAMGLLDRHLKPLGFERGGQVWHRGGGTGAICHDDVWRLASP